MRVVQRVWSCLSVATAFLLLTVGVAHAEWKLPPLYTATNSAAAQAQAQRAYMAMITECGSLKGKRECLAQVHALGIVVGALNTAAQYAYSKSAVSAREYLMHVEKWLTFMDELTRAHSKAVFEEESTPKRFTCTFCNIG